MLTDRFGRVIFGYCSLCKTPVVQQAGVLVGPTIGGLIVATIFLERMRPLLAALKSGGLSLENPDKPDVHDSLIR
mgnify:CR=1 FL=1